jgi:hypothetical protein
MDVVLLVTMGTIITGLAFVALLTMLGYVWAKMKYYRSVVVGEEPEEVKSPSFTERLEPLVKTTGKEVRRLLTMTFEVVWKTCVVLVTTTFVLIVGIAVYQLLVENGYLTGLGLS